MFLYYFVTYKKRHIQRSSHYTQSKEEVKIGYLQVGLFPKFRFRSSKLSVCRFKEWTGWDWPAAGPLLSRALPDL